ncbi:hypothetical protein ACHAW5_011348 [Stephanodiscus triporus]|uniref:DDE Tnp4 domain-containing protein n=1 Tax=Stephanodiscus triporus TaxID=2934178 RepID=A0ABD3QQA0_9STRA
MSDDSCSFVVQVAACTASYLLQQRGKLQKKSRTGRVAIRRARCSTLLCAQNLLVLDTWCRLFSLCVSHVVRILLAIAFKVNLAMRINVARLTAQHYVSKGGQKGCIYKSPPIRNGCILSTSVHLACALRVFAGGSVYDLMSNNGISHTDVMDSVWHVVHAVNNLPEFKVEYPSSVDEQRRIAADFERVSGVGLDNCAGAIDGVLIWTQKLSLREAKRVDGLVLFGDAAYLNSAFIATPYSNVSANPNKKSENNYNFYHSQLRIPVEMENLKDHDAQQIYGDRMHWACFRAHLVLGCIIFVWTRREDDYQ